MGRGNGPEQQGWRAILTGEITDRDLLTAIARSIGLIAVGSPHAASDQVHGIAILRDFKIDVWVGFDANLIFINYGGNVEYFNPMASDIMERIEAWLSR